LHQNKIINWFLKTAYFILRLPLVPFNSLKRKPDFLIIGTQKGGTSSLHHLLSQHSDISFPKKKELHYFSKYYSFGQYWYHTFFPFKMSNKITGEATPNYLYYTAAAERVYRYNKDMKLIVLLRDPIQRAVSQYHMEFKRGKLSHSFEDLVTRQLENTSDRVHVDYEEHYTQVLQRGKYCDQIKNWYSYFKKDQILVLKSEDFFKSPKDTLACVFKFLGLPIQYPENLSPKNTGDYSKFELTEGLESRLVHYFQDEYELLSDLTGISFKETI